MKLSYHRGLCEVLCQLKSCQLWHHCRKITFEKACNWRMTLKITQGHLKLCDSISHILLLISGL